MAKIICYKCKKVIDRKKEKYVILSTIDLKTKFDEHSYYHFQCWIDYFNSKVIEKAKYNVEMMQKRVMNNPMIKGLFEKIGEINNG